MAPARFLDRENRAEIGCCRAGTRHNDVQSHLDAREQSKGTEIRKFSMDSATLAKGSRTPLVNQIDIRPIRPSGHPIEMA
jgi:hypothetical protein